MQAAAGMQLSTVAFCRQAGRAVCWHVVGVHGLRGCSSSPLSAPPGLHTSRRLDIANVRALSTSRVEALLPAFLAGLCWVPLLCLPAYSLLVVSVRADPDHIVICRV